MIRQRQIYFSISAADPSCFLFLQHRHGYKGEHHISAWDAEVHSNKGHNFGQYPFSSEIDSAFLSLLDLHFFRSLSSQHFCNNCIILTPLYFFFIIYYMSMLGVRLMGLFFGLRLFVSYLLQGKQARLIS